MAERPRRRPRLRDLGNRLVRVLGGLGGLKDRRGKEPSLPGESRVPDRPWGGQSCPDLVQSSSTGHHSKVGVRSSSEWDLQNWGLGRWPRRRILGTSSHSLGRLQRPAVGSASDLASCAPTHSMGSGLAGTSGSLSLVQSQEGETSVSGFFRQPLTRYGVDGQGRGPFDGAPSRTRTAAGEGLLEEADPSPRKEVAGPCAQNGTTDASNAPQPQDSMRSEPTRPVPCLPSQQAKDDSSHDHSIETPAFGEPEPPREGPLPARTTCYLVTITLQGKREVTPGEEGGEPELVPSVPWELKPARPAPCPGGPEEFQGCRARAQAPPQEPRPITGCPDSRPWEPQLKEDRCPGRAGKAAGSQATETPGSLDRSILGVLSSEETKSRQGTVPGPGMEEVGTHPVRPESRVVSATLTWRHRPPAQEEVRHRFHKVSLVSPGGGAAPQEESYAYTYHREEVNGVTTCEEETVNSQGPNVRVRERHDPPEDLTLGDTKKFLSHEPIFSKMYTPLPKDKRQQGRLKEASGQAHSSTAIPQAEMSRLSAAAGPRAEGPVAGPREASPHPGLGSSSEIFRGSEERRVTRTVRTTTMVGGRVERRTSSSSSVVTGPTVAEGLPRGRHLARTVRAVVVGPRPADSPSPSRSQALEILSNLVPPEPHSPKAETLRWSRLPQAIPRFQGPSSSHVGVPGTQGQPPNFGKANREEGSTHRASDIIAEAPSSKERDVPVTRLSESESGPVPLALPPQGSPSRTSSSLGPQPLSTLTAPELPTVCRGPSGELSMESRISPPPLQVKSEVVLSPGAPQDSSSKRTEVVMSSQMSLAPFPKRDKVVPEPRPSLTLSPKSNEIDLGSGECFVPSSTKTEVVSGPGAPLIPPPVKTEVVLGPGAPLVPPPVKTEDVSGPGAPLVPPPVKTEDVSGPGASLVPPPVKTEDVSGPGASLVPPPVKTEVVLGPVVPSPTKTEVVLGPKDPTGPPPLEVGASLQFESSQVPAKGEANRESIGEEEEVALTADLELFLDTLRNMEAPEILRTHRLPRAPRSSYLAMYATLPAIDEDQASAWTPGSGPELEPEPEPEPEPDEELENPYLSDDEKLQRRQEKASPGPGFFWDTRPSRKPLEARSPLDMMKLHVADGQGPQETELGPRQGAAGALPSRLEGSLLFRGGEVAPPATLGAKLSSLRPHASPALEKGPGRIPLLSSQGKPQVQVEAKAAIQLPEGRRWEKKEQGKLNTRPGKIILFLEPGCQGEAREVWDDVTDATSWLPSPASLRVLRGGWMLYEKPGFLGRKLVLPEGDMELRMSGMAWSPVTIGSLRRIVRDYAIPEISLFSKEGNEGVQVTLTEALEDAQGQGQPLLASSVTVTAGLWLLYSKPYYTGVPCILEPGVYPTVEAWGSSDPHVNSLKPLRLGCPTVEKPGEPKALVYEATDFQGCCWEVSRDIYDMKRPEDGQSPSLATVGSLRILGGCWVGYEKEGFRGHQYLLEEGEYPDWSHWGGYDKFLTSLRVIRTDFSDPAVMLFEAADFEGQSVGLSEALLDVQLAGHGLTTQAIHVLSGVWVAYEQVGFSGEQYVLEKGVYRNCDDWGAGNSTIASLQPILQVGEHNLHFVSKIQLFSGPDFLGDHISFEEDQASLPSSFQPQSCRVHGGSWILFEKQEFEGEQHVLSEGEFPTLTAMGCLASTALSSLRKVPLHFSEPSIFLYGLECFEGKEIELNGEVRSLQAEGFNNHVLSVRIKGGVWVLCEHSDFRGRQWLVGSTELTNWLSYSGTQRIGSLYPIKQRRVYFCLRNKGLGRWLAVPEDVEDMKAGRVVVSETRAGGNCIWYYEDGLLKNQVAPTMSLQVIGQASPGSKVVLWSESRQPRQTWSIDTSGHICSEMFEDKILDVKGGRGYDRDHAVLWDRTEDRPSQIWDVQVL